MCLCNPEKECETHSTLAPQDNKTSNAHSHLPETRCWYTHQTATETFSTGSVPRHNRRQLGIRSNPRIQQYLPKQARLPQLELNSRRSYHTVPVRMENVPPGGAHAPLPTSCVAHRRLPFNNFKNSKARVFCVMTTAQGQTMSVTSSIDSEAQTKGNVSRCPTSKQG